MRDNPETQWLCSSLQSLSSTVSSIESLGAPSTLKLPLWDKASAEFCFAKSRELLTKPTAWTSYVDVEFDAHILDNAATRQNLVKSTEFLENGNAHRKSITSCLEFEPHSNRHNGKSNFEFPNESKRVSTSYVDRYFEQPKYEEPSNECPLDRDELSYEDEQKINELEQSCRNAFLADLPEFGIILGEDRRQSCQSNKISESSAKVVPLKFDLVRDKVCNLDSGARPKPSNNDATKLNITDLTKKLDFQKQQQQQQQSRNFIGSPRHPNNDLMKNVYSSSSDSMKTIGDNSRSNLEAVRMNIQNFRKFNEQNGHEKNHYPYAISNNPLFMSEPDKRDSPLYSSSESLIMNIQRMRRKSDAEVGCNQREQQQQQQLLLLNSKLLADKYQREVSGLESVKNYLESKKDQASMNLGFGKLTQNMIQLGKNIAQNTRNLEGLKIVGCTRGTATVNSGPTLQKPNHLELNVPLQKNSCQKMSSSPTIHQRILEPPKPYQNDRKVPGMAKTEILVEKVQVANVYRPRTSSLSESKRPYVKSLRRSFHPGNNDSSEDSDSISHSETDIRSRLRFKRRHKRMTHNVRLNFKNQKAAAAAALVTHKTFLHPESARGFSTLELSGKSPPPSTSFLNSLSPPFSSRNNIISWQESAPSSSITFTSNSDLDSDTSSEYPEFNNDVLTFPPSPAP
jgi:hypothetical protein